MFLIPLSLAAALPSAFEDLDLLDARISAFGAATPVDRRLKLARCADQANIFPAGSTAVAVRCTSAGWRILVPLEATSQQAGAPAIRKGDFVDLTVEGTGFSISTAATAVEDGRVGQSLRVRTNDANPAISGAVVSTGLVVIKSGS